MKVEFWDQVRPKTPWLPVVDDRRYVTDISTYLFGIPDIDDELCNECSLCWIYCPEGAITRGSDGLIVDYEDCRGCGLCAHECSRQAISMVEGVDG
jgi:2-oxoacid:acceptor oxidoreductase delta subunit (pyruvate/2-ketoisovalerate family)